MAIDPISPHVRKLIAALLSGLPTADEIQHSMELAYKLGKNDGALELANKVLNAERDAKVAQ